jgi:ABC-type amino acid transport substrate-binding protein
MLALLLLAAAAAPALPADVRTFLARRESCNHWAGEEGYDAGRRRQIERALREARCDALAADENNLREHYREAPDMLAILDQADESLGTPD